VCGRPIAANRNRRNQRAVPGDIPAEESPLAIEILRPPRHRLLAPGLNDAVEIAFEVRISIAGGILAAIRWIRRIQTVRFLPLVRHAVMIAVGGRFAAFEIG